MDHQVVGTLQFFFFVTKIAFFEVTMSITWMIYFFPSNYAAQTSSQPTKDQVILIHSKKNFKKNSQGKCLWNDLVQTKDKSPYSNHTDVI